MRVVRVGLQGGLVLVLGVGREGGLAGDDGGGCADADVGEGGLHLVEEHVQLVLDLGEDVGHGGDVGSKVDKVRRVVRGDWNLPSWNLDRVERKERGYDWRV